MSNIRKKGSIIKNHSLYVLLDKDDKRFFVWYCDSKNVYDAFKQHYKLKFFKTKNWIENMKEINKKPCIFVLEDVFGSRQDCYVLTLIWTRIFIENGFRSIESEPVLHDVNNLYGHNLSEYSKRNEINLNELLDCKNCIHPHYQSIKCDRYVENNLEKLKPVPRKKKRIEVSLTEEEHEILRSKADELGIKLTRYMTESAVNNEIKVIDFADMNEYIEVSDKVHKLLIAYLVTVMSTDTYEPVHIENLKKSIDEIEENQKEIKRLVNKLRHLAKKD